MVAKTPQLIGNQTTNLAESWMNIRCKFDSVKAVNRSQSGSWEFRCMGAGLQHNIGQQWGSQLFSVMTNNNVNAVYENAAEALAKKRRHDHKRRSTEESKAKQCKSKYSKVDNSIAAHKAYSRHDDGTLPAEIIEDVSQEYLHQLKNSFYENEVVVTTQTAHEIDITTRE